MDRERDEDDAKQPVNLHPEVFPFEKRDHGENHEHAGCDREHETACLSERPQRAPESGEAAFRRVTRDTRHGFRRELLHDRRKERAGAPVDEGEDDRGDAERLMPETDLREARPGEPGDEPRLCHQKDRARERLPGEEPIEVIDLVHQAPHIRGRGIEPEGRAPREDGDQDHQENAFLHVCAFFLVKPLGRFNRFCGNRGFLLTTYVPYGIGEISGRRDFLQFCYFFQMETGFFQ